MSESAVARDPVRDVEEQARAVRREKLALEVQQHEERKARIEQAREREHVTGPTRADGPPAPPSHQESRKYWDQVYGDRPIQPPPPPPVCSSCGATLAAQARGRRLCAGCVETARQDDLRRELERDAERCQEAALALEDRRLQLAAAGVPSTYREPFQEPARWPESLPAFDLRTWPVLQLPLTAGLRGKPWAVTFSGPVGVGKSFFAAEILYRWWRRTMHPWEVTTDPSRQVGSGTARWVAAAAIPRLAFGRDTGPIDELLHSPLLVVDDLGRGHTAPAAWGAVTELIYARYDTGRCTVLTTNLMPAELAQQDVGLTDRLLGSGLLVVLTGESRRTVRIATGQSQLGEYEHEPERRSQGKSRPSSDPRRSAGGHPGSAAPRANKLQV